MVFFSCVFLAATTLAFLCLIYCLQRGTRAFCLPGLQQTFQGENVSVFTHPSQKTQFSTLFWHGFAYYSSSVEDACLGGRFYYNTHKLLHSLNVDPSENPAPAGKTNHLAFQKSCYVMESITRRSTRATMPLPSCVCVPQQRVKVCLEKKLPRGQNAAH
jgi:hypothetical protein